MPEQYQKVIARYDEGTLTCVTLIEPAQPGTQLHKEIRFDLKAHEITKFVSIVAAYEENKDRPLGIHQTEVISEYKPTVISKETVSLDDIKNAVKGITEVYSDDRQHGFSFTGIASLQQKIESYGIEIADREAKRQKHEVVHCENYSASYDPIKNGKAHIRYYALFDVERTDSLALEATKSIYSDQFKTALNVSAHNIKLQPANDRLIPSTLAIGPTHGRWLYTCEFEVNASNGQEVSEKLKGISKKFYANILEPQLEKRMEELQTQQTQLPHAKKEGITR